jgi:hypothetical protein
LPDVFITKLSSAGNTLVYSTYLGGNDMEFAEGIAVDNSGNAYVTGYTDSLDFPVENAFQENLDSPAESIMPDAFITKLSSAGNTLAYSTYLGGKDREIAYGIAVDNEGNAYVTGSTFSIDFPLQNPLQLYQGGRDAFVTKLSLQGNSLVYSTYLGGSDWEYSSGIAVDGIGNAYITGGTASPDFPTREAFQENLQIDEIGGITQDIFITKLSSLGNTLVYSTYLGGPSWERGSGIAVGNTGNAYVIGTKGNFNYEHYYVRVAKIRDFLLTLQVSRHEERAFLVRKHIAQIRLKVDNPINTPVANYVVYRKESNGQYQAVKDIPAGEIREGTYTFIDLLPQRDKSYTYKAEALNANGEAVGVSDEQNI